MYAIRSYYAVREHIEGREPLYRVEHRMRTRSGDYRWILNWGRIVTRDASGRPLRALGVHMDVTDRRLVDDALRENEARYRAIVRQSRDAIFLLDLDSRRIIEANDSLLGMTGYSREEFEQLTVYDFVAHDRDDIDRNNFV